MMVAHLPQLHKHGMNLQLHMIVLTHLPMIKRNYALLLIMLAACFSSCEVIGGIFKAGVWVGILLVVVVVFVIIWLVSKAGSK